MKAKKDIVVYKMLEYAILPYSHEKIYCTPYMRSVVKFNLFGRCVMRTDRMTGRLIRPDKWCPEHLHASMLEWFRGKLESPHLLDENAIDDAISLYIDKGIHAYTKIQKRFSEQSDYREFHKAIIPKGSHYFVDEANDEIVADKMIILKKVVK